MEFKGELAKQEKTIQQIGEECAKLAKEKEELKSQIKVGTKSPEKEKLIDTGKGSKGVVAPHVALCQEEEKKGSIRKITDTEKAFADEVYSAIRLRIYSNN